MRITEPNVEQVLLHATRRGTIAHFSADQCIGQALGRYGEWAEDEIQTLKPYVAAGSTVIDVGANVGVHSLAFAEMVGESGRVISIEGQPETGMLLAHNIVANKLSHRILMIQALAGSQPCFVPYTPEPPNDNVGAVSFVNNVHHPEKLEQKAAGLPNISLPLITLDSLKLKTCSLIKIDVEGMEEEVIVGALGLINSCRPIVYFEHANDRTEVLVRLHKLFKGMSFKLYWHVANPFNSLNFCKDPVNIFGGNVELNVLAVPNDRTPPNLPEILDPESPAIIPTLSEALPGIAIQP
jgi:FkbM family methyltransferase